MPAAAAKAPPAKTSPAKTGGGGPSLLARYGQQSRRPLAALAFVLPLLALYEGGVVLLGRQAVRNGADVWLRQFLDRFGFGQYFLLPVLTIGLLLAWHHTTRDRWQVSAGVIYLMFAECAALGVLLLGAGQLQGLVIQGTIGAPAPPEPARMELVWVTAGRGAFVARMLGFVGAGVYEEMLFRLMLLPPVVLMIGWLGAQRGLKIALAVALTSALFSAAHYVGAQGEAFDATSFSFRLLAGGFFALLFVHRGFGIAAGTHALYDIMASLMG
ncbi:MAG TPA: CPBP family intramembrane glutamic endopeptidase [Steroidobacteraceae bacterium]